MSARPAPRSSTLTGIVTGSVQVGEADRVVRLLVSDRGRTAVLARNLRGGGKGWAGMLEPGSRVLLVVRAGLGPLPLITEVTSEAVPLKARSDLDRLALMAYGIEVVSALAPEEHDAGRLFGLLCAWLDLLEAPISAGAASRQSLEAKALTFAGYTPALVVCPSCGLRILDPAVFSMELGGAHHGACASGEPVEAASLLRLEALRRTPLADTVGVAPALPRWLLGDFVRWTLGKAIGSRALVEELEGT